MEQVDQEARTMSDPTEKDLADPLFNAIWLAIKSWDIQREHGRGYAMATGTDVMTILQAVRSFQVISCTSENMHPYECGGAPCCHCEKRKDERHNPDKCALCLDA
jgi:hypothetical protein